MMCLKTYRTVKKELLKFNFYDSVEILTVLICDYEIAAIQL